MRVVMFLLVLVVVGFGSGFSEVRLSEVLNVGEADSTIYNPASWSDPTVGFRTALSSDFKIDRVEITNGVGVIVHVTHIVTGSSLTLGGIKYSQMTNEIANSTLRDAEARNASTGVDRDLTVEISSMTYEEVSENSATGGSLLFIGTDVSGFAVAHRMQRIGNRFLLNQVGLDVEDSDYADEIFEALYNGLEFLGPTTSLSKKSVYNPKMTIRNPRDVLGRTKTHEQSKLIFMQSFEKMRR